MGRVQKAPLNEPAGEHGGQSSTSKPGLLRLGNRKAKSPWDLFPFYLLSDSTGTGPSFAKDLSPRSPRWTFHLALFTCVSWYLLTLWTSPAHVSGEAQPDPVCFFHCFSSCFRASWFCSQTTAEAKNNTGKSWLCGVFSVLDAVKAEGSEWKACWAVSYLISRLKWLDVCQFPSHPAALEVYLVLAGSLFCVLHLEANRVISRTKVWTLLL